LAENKRQDAAVPVVVHFDARIDEKLDWLSTTVRNSSCEVVNAAEAAK
jgi:hypothetical protein